MHREAPPGREEAVRQRRDTGWLGAGAAVMVAGALVGYVSWSYANGGLVYAMLAAAGDSERSLQTLRDYIARTGAFGPAVYVAAVVVEVLVAPIPGTLLYAPGGALFGGFWGGVLSLTGNVIGATVACLLARVLGERLTHRLESGRFAAHVERLRNRSVWIILLLRLNPLTSSDLVSYAAGIARLPVWHVTLGTLIGMAPLCFAQAYAAEQIFRILPGSALVLVLLGLAYVALVAWIVLNSGIRTGGGDGSPAGPPSSPGTRP
jgi:uncharacterized membrane protein YdjX (TVP38/TMEM64 family)